MKRNLLWICVSLLVGAFLSLTGYAMGASSIVVAVDTPPATMDPNGSYTGANIQIAANFFDPLLERTSEGKLIPALAERYEHTDPLSWKFYLRKGVKFQNGNPFTAADVKFTFERLKDPKCCAELMNIGETVASINIIDDYTVVVKTKVPTPVFDQYLDIIFIVDKESTEVRDLGEVGQKPIGTGAYKLVEWVKGSHLKMTANEDYWKGAPPIKIAEYKLITDSSTRFAAIASGEVELVSGVPVELYDALAENPKIEVISAPSRRTLFLHLGNKPGTPWADIRVRQAMYMAINEDEIISKVMRGQAWAAAQIPDPAETGYVKDLKRLPYDPEKAKRLLKEAGYANGFEITLAGPNDRYVQDAKIAEAVAQYLTKINIKVKLDVKPKATFFPELVAGKYDFCLLGWLESVYDLALSIATLTHTYDKEKGFGSWNGTRYSDAEIDKLFDAVERINDLKQRRDALEKLNRLMAEKIAVIPLHYQANTYAAKKAAGINFIPRADGWLVIKYISKK